MKRKRSPLTRATCRSKRSSLCFLSFLVAAVWVSSAVAAGAKKIRPQTCLECHDGLNVKAFEASVHGGLDCVDCHAKGPFQAHEEAPPKVDCSSCHEDAVKQYNASFHGLARAKGITDAPACADCHGNLHEILPSDNPASKQARANIPGMCARCHAQVSLIRKYDIPVADPFAAYKDSVHGKAVAAGNLKAAVCSDCHGAHTVQPGREMTSKTAKKAIPAACGRCHAKMVEDYTASIHGQALAKGIEDAPSCADCHGEHGILRTHDANSPVSPAHLAAKTCGKCHDDLMLTKRYGLSTGRTASYEDSYHGLAVRRGSVTVAGCASCHGGHKILPSSDPNSSIHVSNLAKTCGNCHPGARETFARTPVHLQTSPASAPILFYVRQLYLWLIFGTIGGMLAHNALIFFSAVVQKFRKQRKEKGYRRFTNFQLVTHGMLLTSFITLVVTGFALRFFDAPWTILLNWVHVGEEARRLIHRGAAIVMLLAGVLHVVHSIWTPKGRHEIKELLPRFRDLLEVRDSLKYYWMQLTGRRGARRPHLGRYSYVHKAEYWAVIWGTIIMGATGFALWFPVEISQLFGFPSWGIPLADVIHYYEAWLAGLSIAVWHFFFVIFHPDEYPVSLIFLTGKVTEEEMEHQHPRELQEIRAEAASKSPD
ncbi:MAG: cytochrome b/b6 domain-containing protein [Pseudomonadota bacterium]